MKILHVNTSDSLGGAARAAYRLHRALIEFGIDSHFLVQNSTIQEASIHSPTGKVEKGISALNPALDKILLPNVATPFSSNWKSNSFVKRKLKEIDPDVIHVHWIGQGFLRISDLMIENKPVVFTMHDQWCYTGGCHYSHDCYRFQANCGNCPQLNSNRFRDSSLRGVNRKLKDYSSLRRKVFVGPSSWITEEGKSSTLLKNLRVINLPNPIDTNVFSPIEQKTARKILGLETEKPLVLFGSVNPHMDNRKGYDLLESTLTQLSDHAYSCLTFGGPKDMSTYIGSVKVTSLGYVNDDITLRLIYSAANVTVLPSREENLANIAVESIACGTPVVAFEVGGNSDIIMHLANGYLAKAYDTEDLKNGVIWAVENHKDSSIKARQYAQEKFSTKELIPKFTDLYASL